MYIDDLIEELQNAKKEMGNVPVSVFYNQFSGNGSSELIGLNVLDVVFVHDYPVVKLWAEKKLTA